MNDKTEQNRQRENERYERAQRVWERRMERANAWKREQREKAYASLDSQITVQQIADNENSFYTETENE